MGYLDIVSRVFDIVLGLLQKVRCFCCFCFCIALDLQNILTQLVTSEIQTPLRLQKTGDRSGHVTWQQFVPRPLYSAVLRSPAKSLTFRGLNGNPH